MWVMPVYTFFFYYFFRISYNKTKVVEAAFFALLEIWIFSFAVLIY